MTQSNQNEQPKKKFVPGMAILGTGIIGMLTMGFASLYGASEETALKALGFGCLGGFLLLATLYILDNYIKCCEQFEEDQPQNRTVSTSAN